MLLLLPRKDLLFVGRISHGVLGPTQIVIVLVKPLLFGLAL